MMPTVAVLIGKGVREQILDAAAVAALEAGAIVRWPKGDGAPAGPEARAMLAGADGVMTGWGSPRITADLLADAPRLRILAHAAGTVKPYVSDAVWERGIRVTSAAAAIAVDVAHYAVALMVIGRKNVMELAGETAAGRWGNPRAHRRPDDLRGCTVGIVAASQVGRQVLALLRSYEVTCLLADPWVTGSQASALGARKVELDELFAASDVVSVHAPDLAETRHLVNAARLAAMKDGATLVNTSRGALVDEAALVAELRRRRLWAFLDVTDPEPPPADSPLLGCPNLTLTPHIAGSAGRARFRLGGTAAEELRRCFAGEPPLCAVSRDALARMA